MTDHTFTPAQAAQVRLATIEECARVAENYPSSGSATEHPVEYWIRALAAQPPAAPVHQEDACATAAKEYNAVHFPCSAATEGVVGLEVLRHMADRQRGIGMPPKPMMRPSGSNADEWNVFLEEYTGHGNSFIAVQIAEAIEDAEKRGTLNEPQPTQVSADTAGLIEAALRHAEGLTAQLAKPDWMPRRAHIEQARNSIVKLAAILKAHCDEPLPPPDLDTVWQWDGKELLHDTPDWVAENTEPAWSSLSLAGFTGGITAFTSFGKARLKKGDWLVRHKGEIHAVKDAVYSALSRPERETAPIPHEH